MGKKLSWSRVWLLHYFYSTFTWIFTFTEGHQSTRTATKMSLWGRGHFWRWPCNNVDETWPALVGSHNFTILSMLSSKYMYYECNAAILLDICSNIYPWKPHDRLIFLTFFDIPAQFTCLSTMDYWMTSRGVWKFRSDSRRVPECSHD